MTTHDTLTMRIREKSEYETKFRQLFFALQEDPELLQSFLDDPSSRLIASGIPVARSLADTNFDSPVFQPAPINGESLMEMKFHWWGVDLITAASLMKFIRLSMEMGTGMKQIGSLCSRISGSDFRIADQIIHDLQTILHQQHTQENLEHRSASIHWRVSWIYWATGLPIDILLHFSSRKFSGE